MLKERFIQRIEDDIDSRGIDRINVIEMGDLVDIVKDLAEAENYWRQSEYYRSVVEAMDDASDRHDKEKIAYYNPIDPIKMAMQNASPEEREKLREELKALL